MSIDREEAHRILLSESSYNAADCESALRGLLPLPQHIGGRTRLCLISGIRHHVQLARSSELAELCPGDNEQVYAFRRARNARLIMSNEVPPAAFMQSTNDLPYCIWHPDFASEDTYHRVASEYPAMRYQVGRACAAAGYHALYHELNLLPDTCIAEEARESLNDNSRFIFEAIMAAPTRYAVMNDYDRRVTLDSPKAGAVLNGDTAVVSSLSAAIKYNEHYCFDPRYFNITEDELVSLNTAEQTPANLTTEALKLFTGPLPTDLTTMQKDLLILSAAYEGNVDRYARLRRPGRGVPYELNCLVPGVYRSTAMAMWLSRNPAIVKMLSQDGEWNQEFSLPRAINARHVMNNYIAHLLPTAEPLVPEEELPYWIWWPTVPDPEVLVALAKARPTMRPQCARACIAGDRKNAFGRIMDLYGIDELERDRPLRVTPLPADQGLHNEAEASGNEWYMRDLQRRRAEFGLDPNRSDRRSTANAEWKRYVPSRHADESCELEYFKKEYLPDTAVGVVLCPGNQGGMWDLLGAEFGELRYYLSKQWQSGHLG